MAVIRPPIAAEAAEEGRDIGRAEMVNADRHSIITSLNLHLLLQQQHEQEEAAHCAGKHPRPPPHYIKSSSPPSDLIPALTQLHCLIPIELTLQLSHTPAVVAAAAAASSSSAADNYSTSCSSGTFTLCEVCLYVTVVPYL